MWVSAVGTLEQLVVAVGCGNRDDAGIRGRDRAGEISRRHFRQLRSELLLLARLRPSAFDRRIARSGEAHVDDACTAGARSMLWMMLRWWPRGVAPAGGIRAFGARFLHPKAAACPGRIAPCHPLGLTPSRRRSRRPSIPIAFAERSCRPLPSAAWFRRDECGRAGPPCSAVPQPRWPCTRRGSW
jgi:hypothetical protein